jgi:hypothetical protein
MIEWICQLYMRIIYMEKEKRKSRPNRRWLVIAVPIVILASLCGLFSYYVYPGHSLSEFSRFESSDEVVAFLYEHFELHVTTSAEIRTFLAAYPLEGGGCRYTLPTPDHFANGLDEEVAKLMSCTVFDWLAFPGKRGYDLIFQLNADDQLLYIGAGRFCRCI